MNIRIDAINKKPGIVILAFWFLLIDNLIHSVKIPLK